VGEGGESLDAGLDCCLVGVLYAVSTNSCGGHCGRDRDSDSEVNKGGGEVNPIRDQLIVEGYVSVGYDGAGNEILCAYCVNDRSAIRYHAVRHDVSVWERPQFVAVSMIPVFVKMLEMLNR
jgi:hypothetical protein